MQRTTIIAISAVLLVCAGVAIGWGIWGPRAGEAAEFERVIGELEDDLARSRILVERANGEVTELRERNRRIEEAAERAGQQLANAIGDAQSINDLLREAIAVIERLEAITRSGGLDAGEAAPP
jgi:hypothetical protein